MAHKQWRNITRGGQVWEKNKENGESTNLKTAKSEPVCDGK